MPAAEMPMPCWPRLILSRWNFEPYRSFAKIGGICWRTIPGPLSITVTRKRVAWLGGGGGAPLATATSTLTRTSGRMPASSAASSALSTASLTHVRSALRGLSNPSRWRFLVKNSETEISRCRVPISTAEMVVVGLAGFPSAAFASGALASVALGAVLGSLAAEALDLALGLDLAPVFDLSVALGIAIIDTKLVLGGEVARSRGFPAVRVQRQDVPHRAVGRGRNAGRGAELYHTAGEPLDFQPVAALQIVRHGSRHLGGKPVGAS